MALNKKRKASALEEDATPVKNGQKSPSADPTVKKEEVKKTSDELYETADTPFRVECPVHSSKRKSKAFDDVLGPEREDGGFTNLNITYAVRPGSAWSGLKPYRNFIGKDVLPKLVLAISKIWGVTLANLHSGRTKVLTRIYCLHQSTFPCSTCPAPGIFRKHNS
jgi:hypothetical protein